MATEVEVDSAMEMVVVANYLIVQQAISLFDLLPCRTIELQIAGDWLEDQGLHSFMANVVRQGKWSSISGIVSEIDNRGTINFYGYGHGAGYGTGNGSGRRNVNEGLYKVGNGYGDGHGDGHGYGYGIGYGFGSGYGHGHGSGHGSGYGSGTGHGTGHGTGDGPIG